MKARPVAPVMDAGLARFDPTPDRPGLPGHEVENVRLRFLLWASRRRSRDLSAHPDGRDFATLTRRTGDDLDAAIVAASIPPKERTT